MSDLWPSYTLGELVLKVGSGATPKGGEAVYKPYGTPLIRSMNVVFFDFKRDGLAFIDDTQATNLKNAEVKSQDVLLNITGASIGRVTMAPKDMNGARVNQHVCIIRPTEVLDNRFLNAYLSSPSMQAQIWSDNYGVTRQALTKQQILDFEIPLPPHNEQKRIADKLDAVLARVDACRDRLDRIPAILKRFRQSVLAAAVTGVLTEEWRQLNPHLIDAEQLANSVHFEHEESGGHKSGNAAAPTEDVHDLSIDKFPTGWQILTLRDAVKPNRPITYGILKPGPELEKGVPYIRVADFPGEKLNLSTIRNTSPKIDEDFKRSRLLPGDLLLSIRGTVGRIIEIPAELENANITQDTARLTIQPRINRLYVLWFLRASIAQDRMKKATKGVAVRGINIGDVRALQLPLPSRSEQDEIVRRVESLFAYADGLEARYNTARTQVEKLTPALLAKAFRGELVSQDPNDEPASELLARIAAVKPSQTKKKSTRK